MEDAEIIRQVLAGRHEQFSVLVERYQESLVYFLRKITGTNEDAFDCAQEAFLAAYRNLWRYSEKYTFRAWLYTIARNKAMDNFRRKSREMILWENDRLPEHQPGPEEQWLRQEEAASLDRIVDQLPKHYQQALYLRYKQELSYEEIGMVLNIPISRVKTYLHRGKEKLRQEIERSGRNEIHRRHVDPTIP